MAHVPVQPKFLRALNTVPVGTGNSVPITLFFLKTLYEFWGFCVNGGNSLTAPGGFATSQVTGSYISIDPAFENGANVTLATGNDGVTVQQTAVFTAASNPFVPGHVGKWLVCWKSGSTSTDDSIYPITQWYGSGSIGLDVITGGTSFSSSGSIPYLTSRTGINYRVVDLHAASQLTGYVNGSYMILQFNGASNVNPGQANSQAQILMREENGVTTGTDLNTLTVLLSPSGSWDGTHFLNESTYAEIVPDGTQNGPGTGGGPGDSFGFMTPSETGLITFVADNTFINTFVGGKFAGFFGPGPSTGTTLVIEVPERLYPQANDPNLICCVSLGQLGASVAAQDIGWNYAERQFPSPYDPNIRRWPIAVRCYLGSYWPDVSSPSIGNGAIHRWALFYNVVKNKFLMTDGILCLGNVAGQTGGTDAATGQYSMARARVRSSRFTSGQHQKLMRVGDRPDAWLHIGNGIMWPWDHATIPVDPFQGI